MIRGLLMASGVSEGVADTVAYSPPVKRAEAAVKRKVKKTASKYQREFGRQLKKLKAKHPKTLAKNLMKRAHRATKRVLK
jgi:hypothetical protein